MLLDMGCELKRYASDITCSFPINGIFTSKQKIVYQSVLNASIAVQKNMKEGIRWNDMHILAEREILSYLKLNNLLKGDVEKMIEARLGAVFMPHGLGHLLGFLYYYFFIIIYLLFIYLCKKTKKD